MPALPVAGLQTAPTKYIGGIFDKLQLEIGIYHGYAIIIASALDFLFLASDYSDALGASQSLTCPELKKSKAKDYCRDRYQPVTHCFIIQFYCTIYAISLMVFWGMRKLCRSCGNKLSCNVQEFTDANKPVYKIMGVTNVLLMIWLLILRIATIWLCTQLTLNMTNGMSSRHFNEHWICASKMEGHMKIETLKQDLVKEYVQFNFPYRVYTQLLPVSDDANPPKSYGIYESGDNKLRKLLIEKAVNRYSDNFFFKFYTDDWLPLSLPFLNAANKINMSSYFDVENQDGRAEYRKLLKSNGGVHSAANLDLEKKYYYYPDKLGSDGLTPCYVTEWMKREIVLNYLYLYQWLSAGVIGFMIICDICKPIMAGILFFYGKCTGSKKRRRFNDFESGSVDSRPMNSYLRLGVGNCHNTQQTTELPSYNASNHRDTISPTRGQSQISIARNRFVNGDNA